MLSGCCSGLEELNEICRQYRQSHAAEFCLGVSLQSGDEQQRLHLVLLTPEKENTITRSYGGAPLLAPRWSVNVCLDVLRRAGR